MRNDTRRNPSPPAGALSIEQERQMEAAILKEFVGRPPTVGLVGVSGTGKSTTINSMFKTALPISHVVACTKKFRASDLQVTVQTGAAAGNSAVLRVIDAPGLGEDTRLDPTYLKLYRDHLAECDVIVWVLAARNRAIALDQMYLEKLQDFSERMVFGINQVDIVEPRNWSVRMNLPSPAQEQNIATITEDRKSKIEATLGRSIEIVPYSAASKWQLQELFTTLIKAAPRTRAWMFDALKAFRYDDFIPEAVRAQVMSIVEKR